ncbi:hypothetical protein SAMN05216343_10613 [Oscillibacter sp. PC13]|uniref:hypothetical protein n=1 Tax=Oscillibacter sp. PC13 TaxID=1855299 RepID=UPI0008E9D3D8|nr:hypothetical protein [Oscillibacter sp. PC13]SFP32427.1 hypothetical protein SAMN05216343_10613 [Oscillibacter sp. PC13]
MKTWGYLLLGIYTTLIAYGSFPLCESLPQSAIGFGLCAVLIDRANRHQRLWKVLGGSALTVMLGVLLRYAAEYGEAWWSRSFTAQNVAVFLLLVPCYVTVFVAFLQVLDAEKHSS